MIPPKLKPGDRLSLGWLNGTQAEGAGGRLKVDPRTGLKLIVTSFGAFLTSLAPAEGWFLVTGAGPVTGGYILVGQVEQASGGWSTGPRTVTAFEVNLNPLVPISSTIRVWARCRRAQWRFTYSGCS